MAGEWKEVRLGDVAAIIMGQSPPGTTYNEKGQGLPFFQGVKDFSNRYPQKRMYCTAPKKIAEPGDILFSVRAPIGEINRAAERCCIGRGLAAIRGSNKFDTDFIEYVLRYLRHEWSVLEGEGAVFGNAKKSDLENLVIPWPDRSERHAIAHILGTLDDKIELLRRMNETLEAMARALFKSWFVDFDPVIDNALETGNPIPDALAEKAKRRLALGDKRKPLPEHIRRLFPDRFVDSELGPIPEGWRVGTLGDVAEHVRRGIQPNEIQPGTPYIALEHMPKRCIALSEWGVADGVESNKFEFKHGEILFGKLRPYFRKVGVAPVDGVCSTDIIVVKPRHEKWFGFVLGHVSSVEFVEYTTMVSTGTKMPRTSWWDMARYKVPLPPDHIAAAFTQLIRPGINRIIKGIHESRALAALRDALLPKLISGEIRVRDAERFLAEVNT